MLQKKKRKLEACIRLYQVPTDAVQATNREIRPKIEC